MRISSVFRYATLFVIVFVAEKAPAQHQQPESFKLVNRDKEPLWLTMRGHDNNGRWRDWIPYVRIEPGQTGTIKLLSYQPFDIYIYHRGGESLRFDNVNLCSIMQVCRETGKWRQVLKARRERERVVAEMSHDGTRKVVRMKVCKDAGPDCLESISVSGNANSVKIDRILFPPPDPIPPEPKKGQGNKLPTPA